MSQENEVKALRDEIIKNKDFFLLQFINDIPNQEDLVISDQDLFKVDVLEHQSEI